MTTMYVYHQFNKVKNRKALIYQTQWSLRDFDSESLKELSKWIQKQIKLLDTDVTKYNKTLEQLDLSNRAYNVLKNNGIDTIQQLHKLSIKEDNIKVLKGAGNLVANEILQKIRDFQETNIFKQKK
jgi:DNA-directed RNA polymerase alpha subunit